MELNVPAARETPATGGAGTSFEGAAAGAAAAGSAATAGDAAKDISALIDAAAFLLQAEPEQVKELVRDNVYGRNLAVLLLTLLPVVADVSEAEAPGRIAAASFDALHDKATAGEHSLCVYGRRLREARKACWQSLASAQGCSFATRPTDFDAKLPGADALTGDDVVAALAELSCQSDATVRVQLAVAATAKESAAALRQQLDLGFRVVHRYDDARVHARLGELVMREPGKLSAPARAGEARYNAVHDPLRGARHAMAAAMGPAVAADDVLQPRQRLRSWVFSAWQDGVRPIVRGPEELATLVRVSAALRSQRAASGTFTVRLMSHC